MMAIVKIHRIVKGNAEHNIRKHYVNTTLQKNIVYIRTNAITG